MRDINIRRVANRTPWNISCRAAVVRGQLKHSWLENQVMNKSADDVVHLWNEIGWPALEQDFAARVQEAIRLAEGMVSGFSPAQIVDRIAVFQEIPTEIRDMLRGAVHEEYLQCTELPADSARLRDAATVMGEAVNTLLGAWNNPRTEQGASDIRQAWNEVLEKARQLAQVLDDLPRGIVLP